MKLKGKISITRPSRGGDVDQCVSIQLKDCASGINFLEIDVPMEQFAYAITGLSSQACEFETRGLARIGMKRIYEKREAIYAGPDAHNKAVIRAWLEATRQEEGWMLDTYIDHQGATVKTAADMTLVRYGVYKFVPLEDGDAVDD